MQRIIFHIDMNAYFASVTQQENPLLRGKPIGVGGKPGTRSIIAAASYEAKKLGVKGIMNAREALRLCPNLIIVDGDIEAFADVNRKFVAIFRRYTHLVEVFSIDECWLDLTGYATSFDDAISIARHIKSDMRAEIGHLITCSIGIAPNKLLAKLASDKEKPDGLFVIRPSGITEILRRVKLEELFGIGPRITAHLDRLSIRTPLQLGEASLALLTDEFGILGRMLKNIGQGIDYAPVESIESAAQSIGHSYTLPTDTSDTRVLHPTLFALCEKVGRRLHRHGCLARRFTIWTRYRNFEGGVGSQHTLDAPTHDAKTLLDASWPYLEAAATTKEIRAIGITAHDLVHTSGIPLPLWPKLKKRLAALRATDEINDRFGERTIVPLALHHGVIKRHVSGFKHAQNITPRSQ